MAEQGDWGELQVAADKLGERADQEEASSSRRKGRRARGGAGEGKAAVEEDDEPAEEKDAAAPQARPAPRKSTAGWGDSNADADEGKDASGEARRGRRSSAARESLEATEEPQDDAKQAGGKRNLQRHHDEDGDQGEDIMIIPDLDNDQEEDLQLKVAEAPKNVHRTVQSMRELDKQILGLQLPSVGETNAQQLDLSMLSAVLVPRDKLEEADEPWEFEQLLEQVSQEMNKQKESHEQFALAATEAAAATAAAPSAAAPSRAK